MAEHQGEDLPSAVRGRAHSLSWWCRTCPWQRHGIFEKSADTEARKCDAQCGAGVADVPRAPSFRRQICVTSLGDRMGLERTKRMQMALYGRFCTRWASAGSANARWSIRAHRAASAFGCSKTLGSHPARRRGGQRNVNAAQSNRMERMRRFGPDSRAPAGRS
nr:hypothetical protein CFP56_28837 [Quercus suber]